MKLIRGTQLMSDLTLLCERSERMHLAVAFWGEGATDALGLAKAPGELSVVCNLRMGGTNPKEIRRLREIGARVKHSDTLHAKIYLFDRHGVVGSANASANGLSLQRGEVGGWTEANVLFEAGPLLDETRALFNEIWHASADVTEPDLITAQAAWDRRRTAGSGALMINAPNILEALKSQPALLSDRGIYITVDFFDMSPPAKKIVAKVQKDSGLGEATDAWEGWPEMPNGAHFICFYSDEGGIESSGFWRSPNYRREVKVNAEQAVCFVDQAPSIGGLRKLGPIAEWRKAIQRLVKARGGDALLCVEAGEFAREFL